MRFAWLRQLFIGLAAIAVLSSAPRASAQDARALFERGEAAYRLGQYEDAIDAWERAYALDARPGLQYNLAQAYGRLGRVEEEQRALARYIDETTARGGGDPEQLDLARARLTAIGDRIRRTGIQLSGVPEGATVTIDDAPLQADDDGTYALPLAPGPHRVVVRAEGFEEFSHSIVVRAGETMVVPVLLVRAEERPAEVAEEGSSPLRPLGIASIVLGGAGLATGGVLGVLALGESDGVYEGSSAADRAKAMALGSDVAFGVGAAFAVTGLVLVIVGRPDDDAPTALVVPRVTRTSAGLAVVGRF